MSLIFREPPPDVWEALRASSTFLPRGDPFRRELLRAPMAWPLFTLGLRQILSDDGLDAAERTGWRFFATDKAGRIIAGDVRAQRGAAPKMTGVWRGRQIEDAARAGNDLKTLGEVQERDYEFRMLRMPALRTDAFWLKSLTDKPNLVVPFLTLAKPLQRMKRYAEVEFLSIARSMAERQAELTASLEREG